MEPFYRKIYGQSWHTLKNNLHLLFFGLFASLLGFNEIKIAFDFENPGPSLLTSLIKGWWDTFPSILNANLNASNFSVIVTLIGLFILLVAVAIIAISSQAALMHGAYLAQKNNKTPALKFNQSLQIGLEKFWPVLGINLLNILISYYFLVFIVQPLIAIAAINGGVPYFLLLLIIIFFVLVPLIISVAFATRYGLGYIVVYNQPMLTAFNNGWNLLKINWLITIESALAIIGTTIIFFILMLAIIFTVFTPFIIIAFIVAGNEALAWTMVGLGSLIGVIILIIATALYSAYYNLLWSNIFLRLTSKAPSHSKIHRLAHKHFPHMTR